MDVNYLGLLPKTRGFLSFQPSEHLWVSSRHSCHESHECTGYEIVWHFAMPGGGKCVATVRSLPIQSVQQDYAHPLEWARDALHEELENQLQNLLAYPSVFQDLEDQADEVQAAIHLLDDILTHLAYEANHA